jgi:hydrogenase maturation factor
VTDLSRRVCEAFGVDPLAAIASGALLIAAAQESAPAICASVKSLGVSCTEIGYFEAGVMGVYIVYNGKQALYPRPERDAVAAVFEGGQGFSSQV